MRFLILVTAILAVGYSYVGLRFIQPLPLQTVWKALLWLVLLTCLILPGLSFYLHWKFPQARWTDAFFWVSYSSFGLLCVLAAFVFIRDMGWLAWRGFAFLQPQHEVDAGRRLFLLNGSNALVAGAGALYSFYGFLQARRTARVRNIELKIPDLAPDLDGLRIVQITDLHVGSTIKSDYIRPIVERVNALEPDLVAVTGDLVDGSVPRLLEDVRPLSFIQSKFGTFFVTGNHEYYSGARAWMKALRGLGMHVLANEHRVIQKGAARLLLAGVNDYDAGKVIPEHASDPVAALSGAPPVDYRILLAHQPRSIVAAAQAGFDLQLSGHTHGGQFFPGNLLVYLFQPYVEGLHRHDNTWIYVNPGTGYWGPPLRLGTTSEITLLTLKRA
ncbi:MAG: metallophosphoesterase [Leptospiraceae bacterium]|nr:metallophosphoesterase [Leptospiraceae bacterium]